jgi:hypothetical protein
MIYQGGSIPLQCLTFLKASSLSSKAVRRRRTLPTRRSVAFGDTFSCREASRLCRDTFVPLCLRRWLRVLARQDGIRRLLRFAPALRVTGCARFANPASIQRRHGLPSPVGRQNATGEASVWGAGGEGRLDGGVRVVGWSQACCWWCLKTHQRGAIVRFWF